MLGFVLFSVLDSKDRYVLFSVTPLCDEGVPWVAWYKGRNVAFCHDESSYLFIRQLLALFCLQIHDATVSCFDSLFSERASQGHLNLFFLSYYVILFDINIWLQPWNKGDKVLNVISSFKSSTLPYFFFPPCGFINVRHHRRNRLLFFLFT